MADDKRSTEKWRPVPLPGFEDAYSVSNLGHTRREIARTSGRIGSPAPSQLNRYGYVLLHLRHRGQFKAITLHRLVAMAFLGPVPDGRTIDHINGVKTDNRAANLRFLTPASQMTEAKRLGLLPNGASHWSRQKPERVLRGSHHGRATVTEAVVTAIRELHKTGAGYRRLMEAFGLPKYLVAQIVTRQTWRHVR